MKSWVEGSSWAIAWTERGERIPLSFAQQRLWFLAQMEGVSETYHIPFGLRLKGNLDAIAMRRALDRIVARHEALRTAFALLDGEPVQRIAAAEDSRFVLLEHDLRRHSDAQSELDRLAELEFSASFDLEAGPLIRGRLVRLAEDEHELLITIHHIVFDGWSMEVFKSELSALYSAFLRDEQDPLPSLGVQYADYAVWERQRVEGEMLQRQAAYWKTTLAGAPALLELPTDHPRPAQQEFAGAFAMLALDEQLTAGLKALSKKHHTTLFMTLLAGWALLLNRLSGQTDVVIGMPAANREHTEIENLIGFFVNTLAVRLDLSGSPSVSALLKRARAQSLAAQQHQEIPFEQVVELTQPERSLAHSPLFQVMFAWQNATDVPLNFSGLELLPFDLPPCRVAKFDLTLDLRETGSTITGGIEYATGLFEHSTVERYVGYFRNLLEAMVADDTQDVDRLPILGPAERHRLLHEWNGAKAEYTPGECVHRLFEKHAAKCPDAVAVVFAEEELSYAELNRRANRLAHYLIEVGVRPDERVVICVERGLEMIVALLAVLKAGGAYVPLDPAYPVERLRFMFKDSAPVALLTESHLKELFTDLSGTLPVLDMTEKSPAWQDRAETNPDLHRLGLTLNHLAYIIYTSGSTGMPKGVMVLHKNVARLFTATDPWFHFDAGDVWTLFHSYAFDFSVWEIWGALAYGGRLIVVPTNIVQSPEEFYSLLCRERVTVLNQTPSAFRQLMEAQRAASGSHHLRYVVFGGEALEVATLKPWYEQNPDQRTLLVNMYGITETTVHVTYRALEQADTLRYGGSPIGCRIPDLSIYIIDPHGEPVPVGVSGELYIGGAGVARGYLNRAELTAERFLADPFVDESDARMYRTGDMGRWLSDGNIEFLGRNDSQVKIRGFRIELGEIEARLMEHPSMREAVVVAREDTPGDKRLVAYCTMKASADEQTDEPQEPAVDAEELRSHLSVVLPEYMVPAAYVRLERLPLTPSGKLDRKALPAPEADAYAARGYEAPLGEIEEKLAEIWAEMLSLDRVGRHDNFFSLGGHSLLAVRTVARLRQVLNVELAIRDLFAHPVLADLARGLESAAQAELPPIAIAHRGERIPLSFAQQRLWFLAQMEGVSETYHIPFGLRLKGNLDAIAMRRALDRIVARHEALRTAFALLDGEPVQRIAAAEDSRFVLLEHDLRRHSDAQSELDRLAELEFSASFDLEAGPLIRGRLVRLAEDEHELLITIHHIVFDGWSMEVFKSELSALYSAFLRDEQDPLPSLGVQYADYAVWERQRVEGEMLQRQAAYWKTTLAGAPALLELPTDHPRPAQQEFAGAFAMLALDEQLTAGLKALSKKHHTTLFMTLLAGWALLLNRLSGQTDVVIGMPAANREHTEIENLIGFFVNTLAVRLDLSGSPSVSALLKRARVQSLAAQQHQEIPFEQVVELTQPERSLAHSPLFQVMFAWQNATDVPLDFSGLELLPFDLPPCRVAKFDLTLDLRETGSTITGGIEYATGLFEHSTVERLVERYTMLLREMVDDPKQLVAEIPLLSPEERMMISSINATEVSYPVSCDVAGLFEQAALAKPQSIALVDDEFALTFEELNHRSNQLAHVLRARGIGAESRVGIYLRRSCHSVVAMLAVLKSGAAYLPLDISHPIERLRFIVRDAAIDLLLSDWSIRQDLGMAAGEEIFLDIEWPEISLYPSENLERFIQPEQLAYVLYTSGSTGQPKGVMVHHGGLANYLRWAIRSYIRGGNGSVVHTSFSFDLTITSVFVPLLAGRAVRLLDEYAPIDALAGLLRGAEHYDLLKLTPAHLEMLEQQLGEEAVQCKVDFLVIGGEALHGHSLEFWRRQLPGTRLINEYGPTEAVVGCSVYDVANNPESLGPVPIGGPVANTQIYVLDDRLQQVPFGVPGDLYIAGNGLARGYIGQPELTAERFIPNPFAAPGSRMYRSGDRARYIAGGVLEYLGRDNNQVKLRGYRIELGEIESTLRLHPEVSQAAVILSGQGTGSRLIAYVAPVPGAQLDSSAVRDFLSIYLPQYEVPSAVVVLESLPLTQNGKLDRSALSLPKADSTFASVAMNPVEVLVHDLWAELLEADRIDPNENFFALGGHSLLATRVISRIRQAFSVNLPLRALFEAPTVRGIAARILAARRSSSDPQTVPIQPVPHDVPLPLSFAQQRLWFLDQLQPGEASYNVQLAIRLQGGLDPAALELALNDLIARHEVLRTRFVTLGETPHQIIAPEVCLRMQHRKPNIENRNAGSRNDAIRQLAIEESSRPFDLGSAPLIRAVLFQHEEKDHLLLLVFHHIVIDGWSLSLITKELSALYTACLGGQPAILPPLPIQYADYAVWQRSVVDTMARGTDLDYWKKQLDGLKPLPLPTSYPAAPMQSHRGAVIEFAFPDALSEDLRLLGRREGVTLFMIMLAAFQLLLSRYTGSEDIAIGSPVANRGNTEIEGLIGFFVNTVVVRTRLHEHMSFRQLLQHVREVCLDVYDHQELPFELVVDAVRQERDPGRSPLFDVMFALQDIAGSQLSLPGISATFETIHNATTKFPLNCSLADSGKDISGSLEYATDVFAPEAMQQFVAHYTQLLSAVLTNLDCNLQEIPLLSAAELAALEAWNEAGRIYEIPDAVALFESRAASCPNALAVAAEDGSLTFSELNARSNRIAALLSKAGVTAESRIGIAIGPSVDMMAAVLAVLKSGGAFVPIDLAHPIERLRYIVEDADLNLLLSRTPIQRAIGDRLREICLEDVCHEIEAESGENAAHRVNLDQLAYIIYTSGSTGWPKGVMATRRGLGNYLNWALESYRPAKDGSAVHSSLTSDLTITSLLVPLVAGGAVTLLPQDADAEALADHIEHNGRTGLLKVTPSHLQVIEGRLALDSAFGKVDILVIGGEALRYGSLAFWAANSPETRLVNEYGPTETVVGCCTHEVSGHGEPSANVPIGRPIANTRIYLLDRALHPVPNGVKGEIYIGGFGVARGYFRRPDLTAERFLPDPFSAVPGARMYATGDSARRNHDGELEYLGRADDQVKVRGYRVELGEIEAAILSYPGVQHAAVLLQETPAGGRLVGFYTLVESDAVYPPATLRAALKSRLPDYEIPAILNQLEMIPLTSSGKVDRQALRTFEPESELENSASSTSQRTPVEAMLTDIWAQAEVLGVENLGIHDNFFELGGHSLLATRVISRVRQTFDIEMPLRSLFESPTIAEMAERVEQALNADSRASDPVVPVPRERQPLPLSFAQQRLWFLAQLTSESASYNVPIVWALHGELHRSALSNALIELVSRHEVLRTRFITINDIPFQVVDDMAGFQVGYVTSLGDDPEAAAHVSALAEAQKVFDLQSGPVFRATIVAIGPDYHWLVLTMHHIVIDNWAVGVLMRELSGLYRKHCGLSASLPELPVQYADFAVWQRNWMTGPIPARQIAYWKEKLAGLTPLQLPTDYKRPAVQTFRGATIHFAFSLELSQALRKGARREGATLFMLLTAAFQLLLSRYTGSEDVVIGSPVANRDRAEIENLIGFFVNTLVLRTDLSGQPSFRELLRRVRKTCLDAYAHQDLPFERLVEELMPERDLSRSPLFQVLFALQNAHDASVDLPGLTSRLIPIETGTSKFDLNVSLAENQGCIQGSIEFNPDLFAEQTMVRLARHYESVLGSVIEDPEQNIAEIPLLGSFEQQELTARNRTLDPSFLGRNVVALFESQAEQNSASPAIVFDGNTISFAELNERANRLAHALLELGIEADDRVGLMIGRSMSQVVALMAVLKAGAAYVPLDPEYPSRRLQYMAEDAAISVLLTETKWEANLESAACPRLVLDRDDGRIASFPSRNPSRPIHAAQIAYVIYTSGSTGQPKGAMITHGGLGNYLQWASTAYRIAAGSGSIVHSSLSFDLTVTSLLAPLTAGRAVRLLPPDAEIGSLAAELLKARGLSLLKLTPAHLEVLEHALEKRRPLEGCVNALVIGGEALRESTLQFWRRQAPGTRLINEYGPTEAVVGCCVFEAGPDAAGDADDVSIGRPISNAQIHVLDGLLQRSPIGIPGEIYIGGAGVARGYLGRPDLTAERFVPDPFSEDPGSRLFRTGDRARFHADGNLEFLGRLDDQIKIRGYRLELGSVEAALLALPQISQAAVLLKNRGAGDQRLVAYYTMAPDTGSPAHLDAEEIRAALKLTLPAYEIPSAYVSLAEMPLTVNGKIDRAALPDQQIDRAESPSDARPRSETESKLIDIWTQAEVLGVEDLGIHDNFFDLGGHSLLATRVVSRVRQAFNVELPLRSVFEAPTVAQMAQCVESARGADQIVASGPIPIKRSSSYPLSYAQQRLWFLDQLEPGTASYNVPLAARLHGSVSIPAIEQALHSLALRQEVLRTRFLYVDGEPRQQVDDASQIRLRFLDFSSSAEAEREALGEAAEEVRRPFDLSQGALLRATLIRVAPQDHLLVFAMHHIVLDGWAVGIFLREFNRFYKEAESGVPANLALLPVQYVDFAAWQRGWLTGTVVEQQLGYWRRRLEGLEVLDLLTDRPRPAVQSVRGTSEPLAFPESLTSSLRRLGRREDATLFMTLLAGYQLLLSRYTGRDDIAVGSPVANRNRSEIEGLLGFFVNTLVLRSNFAGQPDSHTVLRRVRQTCLDAYTHQDLPFEKLVEELQPDRDLSRSPLFQVMFSLNDTSEAEVQVCGLPTSFVPLHTGATKFDLNLHLSERNGNISGVLEYNSDLFDASTIRRMLQHYFMLLESMALDPDTPVSELPLLTPNERRQMTLWNQTGSQSNLPSAPWDIVTLFEEQVVRSPGALALSSQKSFLTYAELNTRANTVAGALRAIGVGSEDVVGIHLERSENMLVALLGILKAGAAYLPLDPSYPAERLRFMAADAKARLVITGSTRERQSVSAAASSIGPGLENELCISIDSLVQSSRMDTSAESTFTAAIPLKDAPRIDPQQLAYILYTSGSTGSPKGTMISHAALGNYLRTAAVYSQSALGCGSVVHSSLSFDLTVTSLFLPLLAGKTIRLLSAGNEIDELTEAILGSRDLTLLKLTPSHLSVLEQNLQSADLPGCIRTLVIGGEALPDTSLTFWRTHAPGIRLINEYGPTETTVGCCVYDASSQEEAPGEDRSLSSPRGHSVPIGKPTANQQIYLLDRNMERVPVGVPGEIYIGGAGVGRGYVGRPALTAERFIPDPFGAIPGGRLFRTGDRAFYRENGDLEFLGRFDDQLKVRGYRIEPAQVEAALRRYAPVRDAHVLLAGTSASASMLVAYLSPREGQRIDLRELRRQLKTLLPEHEIPSGFVVLPNLPLTANGKVDRRMLPPFDSAMRGNDGLGKEPAAAKDDAIVSLVATIWSDVLCLPNPSPHDNFFEIGGHSLLATKVVSRIRQAFDIHFPIRALFEAPTIGGIAARVSALLRGGDAPMEPLVAVSRTRALELSYAQQRVWFLHQLDPRSAAYNTPYAAHIDGELDIDALAKALDRLCARHETLRTVFEIDQDEPRQRILPASPTLLRIVDVPSSSRLSRQDGHPGHLVVEEELHALLVAEAQIPFDLSQGPLIRITVYRISPARYILLMVMHHIVVDAWSMGILLRELGALYDSAHSGSPSPLSELPLQYADFAAWHRRSLCGDAFERQRSYWRQQLREMELFELPTDRPRSSLQSSAGAVTAIHFSPEISQGLRRLSRTESSTLFMTLLAAFKVLLANYSGRDDISIGTFVANRTHVGVEEMIGIFVNTLVLRSNLSGDPTFREVLRRVRKVCLDSYTHQDMPFEKLVEDLQPDRDLSRSPLFTILFQVQNGSESPLAMSGLACESLPTTTDTSKFDLHLAIADNDGTLAGAIEYNCDLFDASTIESLKQRYLTLIEAIVADPSVRVGSLDLCLSAEHLALAQWNPPGALSSSPHHLVTGFNLVARFEKQARRTPDAVVLIQGERKMTYAELNRRANQLASHLLELGLAAESRVGVTLDRSCELVIALLAILKAGGAYVPLDPENPAARLDAMTREAGASFIVTNRQFHRSSLSSVNQVLLDGDAAQIAKQPTGNLGIDILPSQLVYVVFTSGSTGAPKGVMGTHAATLNRLDWMCAEYPFAEGETCCIKTPLSFVDSVCEIFGPMLAGIPSVLVPAALNYNLPGFLLTLRQHKISRVVMVPSVLETLFADASPDAFDLPAMRLWFSSGEALSGELAHQVFSRVPHVRLFNLYGASENAADVTHYEVLRNSSEISIPLGRPIDHTHVYILDRHLRPVPTDMTGEIYVAGECLARGYIGCPDLTAERFLPNPFEGADGDRMYRTGDLGRRRHDGTILFAGRADQQIKIRGRRIELGEVESILRLHPAIERAVVIARNDDSDSASKHLIAYFVPAGRVPASDDLRAFLKLHMPACMVPERFIPLEALPLTISGKVDRWALPRTDNRLETLSTDDSQVPHSDAERIIAEIWKKLLKIDHIGLDENFFDAGGHSLLIVKISREIQRALHREISVLDLFTHPTIRTLASLFGNGREDAFAVESIQQRSRLRSASYQRIQLEVQGETKR